MLDRLALQRSELTWSSQSFPNQDGMRAQLESHLADINRTADVAYDKTKPNDAIDLVVVTDSEAILGIGGKLG